MNENAHNTIKATELRNQLEEVFDKVNGGQEVIVTHRFKQPLKLEPIMPPPKNKTALSGLKTFDEAAKQPSPYSSKTSLKDLYSKSIAKKYAR